MRPAKCYSDVCTYVTRSRMSPSEEIDHRRSMHRSATAVLPAKKQFWDVVESEILSILQIGVQYLIVYFVFKEADHGVIATESNNMHPANCPFNKAATFHTKRFSDKAGFDQRGNWHWFRILISCLALVFLAVINRSCTSFCGVWVLRSLQSFMTLYLKLMESCVMELVCAKRRNHEGMNSVMEM